MENLNEGKNKKPNYMTELAEIDAQSAIVAMEAKINNPNTPLSLIHISEPTRPY